MATFKLIVTRQSDTQNESFNPKHESPMGGLKYLEQKGLRHGPSMKDL